MQKDKYLKCSHCSKKVQVLYADGLAEVEIAYDNTANLHIIRKNQNQ